MHCFPENKEKQSLLKAEQRIHSLEIASDLFHNIVYWPN